MTFPNRVNGRRIPCGEELWRSTAHMRYRILLLPLDQQPHRVEEFAGYLIQHVDPAMAVRKFKMSKRTRLSLDRQVQIGTRKAIMQSLLSLIKQGILEAKGVTTVGVAAGVGTYLVDNAEVKLSAKGIAALGDNRKGSITGGVTYEMLRLLLKGEITVDFDIGDVEEVPVGTRYANRLFTRGERGWYLITDKAAVIRQREFVTSLYRAVIAGKPIRVIPSTSWAGSVDELRYQEGETIHAADE